MVIEAIFTADIVNSSLLRATELDEVLAAINALIFPYAKKHEFYRGDSFHTLLNEPETGLELATLLRLCVRKMQPSRLKKPLDIRIAIGLGEIDTPIKKLSTATGEAFVLSGRELDKLSQTEQCLSIVTKSNSANEAFQILSEYSDLLLANISYTQAEVLYLLLNGFTETLVAEQLRKTQPTINRIKKAGHYNALQANITHYRAMLKMLKTNTW
jgi:hypothetical protein